MSSITPNREAVSTEARALRVLGKAARIVLAVSLLAYPVLLLGVNIFAPDRISPDTWIIQNDHVSPVGYIVLLFGLPLAVAMFGLRSVLSTHRWNSSGFTRLQRGMTLVLGLVFTVLAFWAAFYYGILVNAWLT
jgi:hypothetical protein